MGDFSLPLYTFEQCAAATGAFAEANIIGRGGSGTVYRGELRGEPVAVKRLTRERTHEALQDVSVVAALRHPNVLCAIGLVRLVPFAAC